MNRGTLGDTSYENGGMRGTTRGSSHLYSSSDSTQQLSPIRNHYDRPSTSTTARKRGVMLPRKVATKSTNRQEELSNIPVRGAAHRKKKTYHQRQLQQMREIVKLQKSTKLQIPRAPFSRVVREISLQFSPEIKCYSAQALEALHEATEMYITQVLQDSYMLTLHRNCVTLSPKDMDLVRALKISM